MRSYPAATDNAALVFTNQATLVVTIVSQLETHLHVTVLLPRSDRTARRVHSAISIESPSAFFISDKSPHGIAFARQSAVTRIVDARSCGSPGPDCKSYRIYSFHSREQI